MVDNIYVHPRSGQNHSFLVPKREFAVVYFGSESNSGVCAYSFQVEWDGARVMVRGVSVCVCEECECVVCYCMKCGTRHRPARGASVSRYIFVPLVAGSIPAAADALFAVGIDSENDDAPEPLTQIRRMLVY